MALCAGRASSPPRAWRPLSWAHPFRRPERYARSTAALRARAPPLWEGEPMRRSIVNDPENLVPEALEGLVLSNPLQLELHEQHRFVTRRERARNKVGLVSGGGSGHEIGRAHV